MKNNQREDWDYEDLRDSSEKSYMLRFLPYLETPDGRKVEVTIGYHPGRGYGYGSWEEFFRTLPQARKRMEFLISALTVENIELRKAIPGGGMATTLINEWHEGE